MLQWRRFRQIKGKDATTNRATRILTLLCACSGRLSTPSPKLLTKGDNNIADDTELYARGQSYLDRKEDIIGSVRGYVPGVGYVTILLSENPRLKAVMLGLMGLMVMLQRE